MSLLPNLFDDNEGAPSTGFESVGLGIAFEKYLE